MRIMKAPIRLYGIAGWFEPSFGANVFHVTAHTIRICLLHLVPSDQLPHNHYIYVLFFYECIIQEQGSSCSEPADSKTDLGVSFCSLFILNLDNKPQNILDV